MSEPQLPRDVFVALAAVAWADGKLDPDEADAIVRAAVDAGLSLEEIGEIEAAARQPIELGALEGTSLSKHDRVFAYAVASWIARLDGQVTSEESAVLARLGEILGVPERLRTQAEELGREIAALPEGDRPARYDLLRLHALLGERLREGRTSRGVE